MDAGTVITRRGDNKGKRDERVHVHAVVVEHLRKVIRDNVHVFPWSEDEKALWTEFGRIQREVGIHLPCLEGHKHTPSCHIYGFHDLRRAFATVNAKRLKPETLQRMMRHRSYKTTLSYINLAEQMEEAVDKLRVPEVLNDLSEPTVPHQEASGKQASG